MVLEGGYNNNPALPDMASSDDRNFGSVVPLAETEEEPGTYFLCFADKSEAGFGSSTPTAENFKLLKYVVIHTQSEPSVSGSEGVRSIATASIQLTLPPISPRPPTSPAPPARPPAPPHMPCDASTGPILASLVESCTAVGVLTTSRCENAYDGNYDGYKSLATKGSDIGRSLVLADALSSRIVFNLKESYDVSNIEFYQRLYNGFDNQVDEVTIRLYDISGSMVLNQNAQLARARPPLNHMDTFSTSVKLSYTTSDVKRIEIYITKTDDNDDSGFAEIDISHECASPPPLQPPPPTIPPPNPSSPSPPSSPPFVESFQGSVDGVRIAYAFRGTLGSNTNHTNDTQRFSVYECANFCGAGSEFQFFSGASNTLPHTMHQCTCYDKASWTVFDSSAVGFVHGTATQSISIPSVPGDTSPSSSQIMLPMQDYILPVSVPPTTTAFDITLTFTTQSITIPGNIFRISPWRINDCRPCLGISAAGRITGNLMFSEKGWWKYAETPNVVQPNTEYTVRIVLDDRKLRVFVYHGSTTQSQPFSEANTGLALTGEFPRNEKTVFFAGNDNSLQVSNVLLDTHSIAFANSHVSDLTMHFNFDSTDILKNSIRYHVGFEAAALTHASQISEHAISSPSTAVSTPNGFRGSGVLFDRHSALVLQSGEKFLNLDHTTCAWFKRTLALDTLFTTIFGFGEFFVVHFAAYFSDVSLGIGDLQLRATPTSVATPGSKWAHACASFAVGGSAILYINGTRVATAPLVQGVSPTVHFAIGASIDPSVYAATGNDRGFGGIVDDVKSWARQLTDDEIHVEYSYL